MPAIISDKFRIFNATQFVESLTEGTTMGSGGDPELGDERTRLYFFVGRPQRWDAYLEIYSQMQQHLMLVMKFMLVLVMEQRHTKQC